MSYLVLARKWRPQTFADLVGQGHVSRTLENAIAQGRVAHAFLFTGVRGVGKTTSARILAKALNCEKGPTASPCLACPPCVDIAAGSDVDVQEIDGASYNGVDEVRRLQESLPYRPQRDRFKVFIVDEVHMLSQSAWNAFLKTLEEPPPHVKFIFATTEVHKVPVTILSRCQRYDFKMIAARTIGERLRHVLGKEGIEADDAAVGLIAREAAGSMRDAMSLLDQAIAWGGERLAGEEVARVLGVASRSVVHRLVGAVVEGRAPECLELIGQMVEQGYDLAHLARDLLAHLRDVVVAKVCHESGTLLDLSEDERAEVDALAKRADADDLVRLHQGFSRSYDDVVRSVNPRAALEMVLVRLARRPPLVPLDELLSRLNELERRLGGGGGPGGRPGARPAPGGGSPAGRPGVGLARPGAGPFASGNAPGGGPFGGQAPGGGAFGGSAPAGGSFGQAPGGNSFGQAPGGGGPLTSAGSSYGGGGANDATMARSSDGGAMAVGSAALATAMVEPMQRPGAMPEPAPGPKTVPNGYEAGPRSVPNGGPEAAARAVAYGGPESGSRPVSNGGYDAGPRPAPNGGYDAGPRPAQNGGHDGSARPMSNGGHDGSARPMSNGGHDGSARPMSNGGQSAGPRPAPNGGYDGSAKPASNGGYDGSARPASNGGYDGGSRASSRAATPFGDASTVVARPPPPPPLSRMPAPAEGPSGQAPPAPGGGPAAGGPGRGPGPQPQTQPQTNGRPQPGGGGGQGRGPAPSAARGAGPVRNGNGARPSGWRPGADAQQTPLPPPPPGVDMVRWRRIVDGIRVEKPALASVLDGAVPLQLSAEQAVLAFPPDGFLSGQASEALSVELLTQRVRAELGPSCAVSFELSPEASTGLTVGRLRAREWYERKRASERVVEEHPLVRAAIEALEAELRDVIVPEESS